MANIKSQIKRNKTNEISRLRNKAVKSELRTHLRNVRSAVTEISRTSRNTQGVTFAKPRKGDSIVAVARNVDHGDDDAEVVADGEVQPDDVASDPDVQSTGNDPVEPAQQGDAPGGDQE